MFGFATSVVDWLARTLIAIELLPLEVRPSKVLLWLAGLLISASLVVKGHKLAIGCARCFLSHSLSYLARKDHPMNVVNRIAVAAPHSFTLKTFDHWDGSHTEVVDEHGTIVTREGFVDGFPSQGVTIPRRNEERRVITSKDAVSPSLEEYSDMTKAFGLAFQYEGQYSGHPLPVVAPSVTSDPVEAAPVDRTELVGAVPPIETTLVDTPSLMPPFTPKPVTASDLSTVTPLVWS